MSYSCSDFTDDVCRALGVGSDSIEETGEQAAAEIKRMQAIEAAALRLVQTGACSTVALLDFVADVTPLLQGRA